ncbi:hypothetical protein [Lysinibacillus xylanilyticus]|uniref:hypothetical protein n=1 Tax=Lysinibacillus xylanilyticus TaxID=582475 RepID=UPI003CFDC11D
MKKLLIAFLAIFIFSVHQHAGAKVIWDGAEIVEDQNGKMTFKKDVKIYKKLPNGQFESLVVKRNDYFRVYSIENYNNQTYYWMSSGYRVQATDLVIFKEVPYDVKQQIMKDYYYTVTNPKGAEFLTRRSETLGSVVKEVEEGYSFFGPAIKNGYITQTFRETEYPTDCDGCNPIEHVKTGYINAKNVEKASVTTAPYTANTFLVLTKDADLFSNPITKKEQNNYLFSNNYFDKQTLNILPKGTVVHTNGKLVGGQLQLESLYNHIESGYIDLKNVAPLPTPTTQYMQYGLDISSDFNGWTYVTHAEFNTAFVPRNEAVQVYASNGIKSFISYKDIYGFVPSNALSTKKASVPSITGTISPKSDLTFIYHNLYYLDKPLENILTSTDGKSWLLEDGNGFVYEETDKYFRFKHQHNSSGHYISYYPSNGGWFTIQKPIQEGSKIDPFGKVLTIFDTYTTPAGKFNNVFLTDYGYYIAPGYGVIQFWESAYATEIK